jgi:predicted NBD/HSP70 family sugar kinase
VGKNRLTELLAELNKELHEGRELDVETRQLLAALNEDIKRLTGSAEESPVIRARELESRFAANHPVAERIARELADVLAKMGI